MYYQISLFGALIMALSIHGMTLPDNSQPLEAVTSGVNDFITRFNKVVAKEQSGNYISSGFSVNMVLSMAMYGADGNTKSELQQSLRTPVDETVSKNGTRDLIDYLNNIQGVELAIANKVFTATGFKVKNEFKHITKTYFKSESESLDFSKAAESAAKINSWAATNTKDRIKELLTADDLDASTAIVLVNAVYFKGTWADPFDPDLTRLRSFHVDKATTKMVSMMYREGYYNWGAINDVDAKFIEFPYKNRNTSMFVILPDEIDGLPNVERNLHKVDLSKLNRFETKVRVFMPKFKVESTFDLKSILIKLNIRNIFEDSANFNRISDSVALKVSKVIQKAFIEVNEKGSEAAAVTGIGIQITSAMLQPPPKFVIDRPFLCVIAVKHSRTIQIFNARIVDPSLAPN